MGFPQPGRDRFQQRSLALRRVLVQGHLGAHQTQSRRAQCLLLISVVQHQQHALGATQFHQFVDQEQTQVRFDTDFVQPHPRVHQALERLAHIAGQAQVGQALRFGQAPKRSRLNPGQRDVPIGGHLVQKAAA